MKTDIESLYNHFEGLNFRYLSTAQNGVAIISDYDEDGYYLEVISLFFSENDSFNQIIDEAVMVRLKKRTENGIKQIVSHKLYGWRKQK